jgi:hypothetical protein
MDAPRVNGSRAGFFGLVGLHGRGKVRVVVPLVFPAVRPLRALSRVIPFEGRRAFVAP